MPFVEIQQEKLKSRVVANDEAKEIDPEFAPGPTREGFCAASTQHDEQLNSLAEKAADPDLRTQRIEAIRNAIADGSYTVSAEDVAAKLLVRLLQK